MIIAHTMYGEIHHNLGNKWKIKSHKFNTKLPLYMHICLSCSIGPRNITNFIIDVSEFVVGWESEMYNATVGEAVQLCLHVRSESTVETSVRFSVNTSSGQAQGMCFRDIV